MSLSLWTSEVDQMPIWSDVDQILLSFTSTTSDIRISDQLLMSKGTGSLLVFSMFSQWPILSDECLKLKNLKSMDLEGPDKKSTKYGQLASPKCIDLRCQFLTSGTQYGLLNMLNARNTYDHSKNPTLHSEQLWSGSLEVNWLNFWFFDVLLVDVGSFGYSSKKFIVSYSFKA